MINGNEFEILNSINDELDGSYDWTQEDAEFDGELEEIRKEILADMGK